jgi:hypothetical protein
MAVVRADRLEERTAHWLSEALAVGGDLLQVYSDPELSGEGDALAADRRSVERNLVPCRNYLQLVPSRWDGSIRTWRVVSEVFAAFELHEPSLSSFIEHAGDEPLHEWANLNRSTTDLCDAVRTVRDPARLQALSTGLADARITDLLLTRWPPPVLSYSARWTGVDAPCARLSRLEVDSEGSVRACRHGKVLGTVGEDLCLLRERLSRSIEAAASRREAPTSEGGRRFRCPFPGVPEEEYVRLVSNGGVGVWRRIEVLSHLRGLLLRTQRDNREIG